MLDLLKNIDNQILFMINWHHSLFWDVVMWYISSIKIWIPLYVIMMIFILKRFGWKESIKIIICVAVIILFTDQLCSSIIRPVVERLRPSNPANPISSLIITIHGYHGGKYGFPSCHAANTMALAVFYSLVIKSKKILVAMLVWSVIVSLSRLYLGVHYPSDLLGGWIVGILISFTIYYIYRVFNAKFNVSSIKINRLKIW